jgi:uncharacterized protein
MLVYLHGLNSSGRSAKAIRLRALLAPYPVLAPDYPAHRPRAAVERLTAFFAGLCVQQGNAPGALPPAVIGSSMGGFYAQWLARRCAFSHLYLINPALTPWDLFPPHIGEIMTSADGETYPVTADLIAQTRAYRVADPCDGVPTTLFMDRGDEIIDFRIAESLYRRCGRLRIWDGGDHAFQHLEEAAEEIRTHLDATRRDCLSANGRQ